MSDRDRVEAEARGIAEREKLPVTHCVYPTKQVSEDASRRRAVASYAEGIIRGRRVTAEQVEAAARAMHNAQADTPWGESRGEREADMAVQRSAFRAAGLLIEGDDSGQDSEADR